MTTDKVSRDCLLLASALLTGKNGWRKRVSDDSPALFILQCNIAVFELSRVRAAIRAYHFEEGGDWPRAPAKTNLMR